MEFRKHGDYKLLDFWLRIFVFFYKIFGGDSYKQYINSFHTISVLTDTLYSPVDSEPSPALVDHETFHIYQRDRDGLLLFILRYIFSRTWRLVYEVGAYRKDGRGIAFAKRALTSGQYFFWGWSAKRVEEKIDTIWS